MGFFSDIKDKIFNRHHETVTTTASANTPIGTPVQAGTTPPPSPAAPQSPVAPVQPTATQPSATAAPTAPGATATAPVDVAGILDQAVAQNGQELNWRKSIVDLMKALGIDSSLASRKALAAELNYTGDTSESATMNNWLHKQVLQKLAANGGKVPAELLD